MASLENDACTNYPDFAVICSFIENFGEKLNVTLPNIGELQTLLENSDDVNPLLAQTIAYLLRRIKKSIKLDKWEKCLQKFAHSCSHEDGWELERSGFKKAKLEVKIRVLKNLFEKQFDLHKSFKEKINLLTAKELRLQPCGRDKLGVSYWCQIDEYANIRIYKDDQDEETWNMAAKSREDLVSLIEKLQAQIPQKMKRETSVEESQSETTTPMVLSRAPTPIDSTFHTPETSNRTSPIPEAACATTVPESYTALVPEVGTSFVPEAVSDLVPEAVSDLVPEAVSDLVPEAVTALVPEAVTALVPEAVTDLIPEAVTDLIPEAVTALVPEAVTALVPEAVTDLVPSDASDAAVQDAVCDPLEPDSVSTSAPNRVCDPRGCVNISASPAPEVTDSDFSYPAPEATESAFSSPVLDTVNDPMSNTESGGSTIIIENIIASVPEIVAAPPQLETDGFIAVPVADSASVQVSDNSSLQAQGKKEVEPTEVLPALNREKQSTGPTNEEKDYKSRVKEKELPDNSQSGIENKDNYSTPTIEDSLQSVVTEKIIDKVPIIRDAEKLDLERMTVKPVFKDTGYQKSKLEKIINKFAAKTASDASKNASLMGKIPIIPKGMENTEKAVTKCVLSSESASVGPPCQLKDSNIETNIVKSTGKTDICKDPSGIRDTEVSQSGENICTRDAICPKVTESKASSAAPVQKESLEFVQKQSLKEDTTDKSKSLAEVSKLNKSLIDSKMKKAAVDKSIADNNKEEELIHMSNIKEPVMEKDTKESLSKLNNLKCAENVCDTADNDVEKPKFTDKKEEKPLQHAQNKATLDIADNEDIAPAEYVDQSLKHTKKVEESLKNDSEMNRASDESHNVDVGDCDKKEHENISDATSSKGEPSKNYVNLSKPEQDIAKVDVLIAQKSVSQISDSASESEPQKLLQTDSPACTDIVMKEKIVKINEEKRVLTAVEGLVAENEVKKDYTIKYGETNFDEEKVTNNLRKVEEIKMENVVEEKKEIEETKLEEESIEEVKEVTYKEENMQENNENLQVNKEKIEERNKLNDKNVIKDLKNSTSQLMSEKKPEVLKVEQTECTLPQIETIDMNLDKDDNKCATEECNNKNEAELLIKVDLNGDKALPSVPSKEKEKLTHEITEDAPSANIEMNVPDAPERSDCPNVSESKLDLQEGESNVAESCVKEEYKQGAITHGTNEKSHSINIIQQTEKDLPVAGESQTIFTEPKEASTKEIITPSNNPEKLDRNNVSSEIVQDENSSNKVTSESVDSSKTSTDNMQCATSSDEIKSGPDDLKALTPLCSDENRQDREICDKVSIDKPEPRADSVAGKNANSNTNNEVVPKESRNLETRESASPVDGSNSTKLEENKSLPDMKSAIVENKNDSSTEDDTIEEPVMIVKGDGEGALCDSKNPALLSILNWWEDFDCSGEHEEEICEDVQYFWGNGTGADCDAGNSGDEAESVVESNVRGSNSRKKNQGNAADLGKTVSKEREKLNGVEGQGDGEQSNTVQLSTGTGVNNKEVLNEVSPNNKTRSSKKESQPDDDLSDSKNCNDSEAKPVQVEKSNERKDSRKSLKKKDRPKKKCMNSNASDVDDGKSENSEDSEAEVRPRKARGRGRPKKTRSSRFSEKTYEEQESDDETGKDYVALKHTSKKKSEAPRQRSARIAKIREREETERRELEAMRMEQLLEENKLKAVDVKAREERKNNRGLKKEKKEKKREKKKKKKKKKKGKVKNISEPWAHSATSSSSSSEEEEILEIEDEENEELVFKSDHEFSPESDIGEEDAQPIKRARTARKIKVEERAIKEEVAEKVEESDSFDDTKCGKCDHQDHPETILLCDLCDAGWHLSCLRPPLLSVPEGDWTCPSCEHLALIEKLKGILESYDALKKRAENEELRRQRLAYINVSLDNVLPEKRKKRDDAHPSGYDSDSETGSEDESGSDESGSESSSSSDDVGSSDSGPLYTLRARPSRTSKEQVEDFDELIDEAIRDEMEAAIEGSKKRVMVGRGKDIANIMQGEQEEDYVDEEKEEGIEAEEEGAEGEPEPKEELPVELPVQDEVPQAQPEAAEEEEPSKKRKRIIEDESDEESKDDDSVSGKRRGSTMLAASSKKKRKLTDLDAVEDQDDSDEDFKGSSADDSDEEHSEAMSTSLNTASESDDSEFGSKRRSGRYDSQPLRRSSRNRRNLPSDYDSEPEKMIRRGGRKRFRDETTSEEDDDMFSSGSDSYSRQKPKRKSRPRQVSKKGRRGGRGKKKVGKKTKKKKPAQTEKGEGKPKPRVRYSKPKKVEESPEEMEGKRRVTRGRQINFCDTLFISEEEEEEEEENRRGKVMKGERKQSDSSDYEESADDCKNPRGVRSGLGRGKVMKDDEDDSDYEETPRKSATPSTVTTSSAGKEPRKESPVVPPEVRRDSPLLNKADVPTSNVPVSHAVESLIGGGPDSVKRSRLDHGPRPGLEPNIYANPGKPQIQVASSPVPVPLIAGSSVSITPVSYVPNPSAIHHTAGNIPNKMAPHSPLNMPPKSATSYSSSSVTGSPKQNSEQQANVTSAIGKPTSVVTMGRNSPGPKWHMPINSGAPSRMGTPPRATMDPNLNPSTPPPYRSSPNPAHPVVAASHPSGYPHYPPHEHYAGHAGFPPGYHAPRHPIGHAIYGPPGSHPAYPHHGGLIRGPPHEILRHPPPTSRGSPNHSTHPLVMKPGYQSLEPMPYAGAPIPVDASGRHGSAGGASEESKESCIKSEEKGEFSSGLMSYFSSQREDVD